MVYRIAEAHLFHRIDVHYDVPRWVIGASPESEDGWAFAESDASSPDLVTSVWTAWDGKAWHEREPFRFIRPAPAGASALPMATVVDVEMEKQYRQWSSLPMATMATVTSTLAPVASAGMQLAPLAVSEAAPMAEIVKQ